MLFLQCFMLDYICFNLCSAVGSLLSYMSLHIDNYLSCDTLTAFYVVPPTFWNNVLRWHWIAKCCGNFVIGLWPIFSLRGLNEKQTDGVNLQMNKILRNKWAWNNRCAYIAFYSLLLFSSLLSVPCDVKSAWGYLGLGLYYPPPRPLC